MTDPKEMRLLRQRTNEEIKDEMKNRISMALKDPILQQGFEIICRELADLQKENKKYKQQKNKVKFIVKDLLLVLDGKGGEDFRKEVLQSAEQLLKESE